MKLLKLNRLIRSAALPVAAAAALAALPAQAANSAADQQAATKTTASGKSTPSTEYRGLRATQVIGKSVRNPQGSNIGQIRDLVVNMNTGQVRYAMLEFDPGMFQGERLFAVPTTELRLGTDDQLVYNMTRDKLEKAAVPRAEWNTRWRDPDYLANVDKVWGVTQPSHNARAFRVSDLLGKDVRSRSGEDIGDIEELVINMAAHKVHYAVLAFDPSWTTPEKRFAFPISAFELTADEVVLDVDMSTVQAMKSFDESRYVNLNDRKWVRDVDVYLVTVLPGAPRQTVAAPADTAQTDLFSRLDHDKNGWLERQEVRRAADIDRNWTRFDRDKDGRVSNEEFTSGYAVERGR